LKDEIQQRRGKGNRTEDQVACRIEQQLELEKRDVANQRTSGWSGFGIHGRSLCGIVRR
jgi:hypothetical protein